MTVEWFVKLKEIDSLGKMRINHLKLIGEQQERLNKLHERKELSLLQTNSLNQEQRTLQQSLHDLEKKLRLFSVQKENLISLGGDEDKVAKFDQEIAALEDQGLMLMERQDHIKADVEDAKTFQLGLEKTMSEIDRDVQEDIKNHEEEIQRLDLRLRLLEEELPSNFQQVYKRTQAKNLHHGSFTRVENGSCFFCRYKISRQDESEIDTQQNLKTCNQCGRIFLPFGY